MAGPSRRTTLIGLATAAAMAGGARAGDPLVRTTAGPVRGLGERGLQVFRGLRYGADTGLARFQPPRPPAPWREPVRATAFGAASPQRGLSGEAQSEDCLFLNLWTPAADAGRRPVLVYIHGGAYSGGSGSAALYDGARLAARGDVVVVTLNHRLNAFGYLSLARFDRDRWLDSGNAGQLDLILALQWVRNNIAAFGGDPGCVTVFGQSGGGAKIATLMAMPAAKGLFHRAMTMSGQQVTASGPLNARRRTEALLEALKSGVEDIDQIDSLPFEKIVEAMGARDPILPSGGLYFGPVLDDRNLTRHPFWPDAPPQSATIPMIIGNTRDETRAFLGGDERNHHLTWADLPARLGPELRVDISPETVVAAYRDLYPAMTPSEVFFAASTASRSWRAAVIEAEARARQGAPTWAYQLDWRSPKDGGKWGAPHTLDIPLVFGTLDAPGSYAVDTPEARKVSETLQDILIAFARTGDPNHAGLQAWEPYGLPRRETLLLDVAPRLADDPRGAERELFAGVPYIQPGT